LVTELCDLDLKQYIENSKEMNPFEINSIMFQILNGLSFMHGKDIIHGDIRPSNILKKGDTIKLADFGFSFKKDESIPNMHTYVCSLPYRPLEVFKHENYSFPADIWSVGCVFAELVNKKMLFPFIEYTNATIVSKINEVFKINVPGVQPLQTVPAELFEKLSDAGIDLIQKLMQMNPQERIKAMDALEHPYFSNKKKKIK